MRAMDPNPFRVPQHVVSTAYTALFLIGGGIISAIAGAILKAIKSKQPS